MNLTKSFSSNKISFDFRMIVPIILICIIGIVTLLSTTVLSEGGFGDLGIVWKQAGFLITGLILYIILSYIDLSYLKYWQTLLVIYLITTALLLATILFGPVINGVQRWLVIAGIQIQPSEIAKVAIIVISAGIFAMRDRFNELIVLFVSLLSAITFFVLIYLEPGGSMSLLTLTIWFVVSFLALSNPLRNTFLLLILGSISGGFLIAAVTNSWIWYLLSIFGIILTIFIMYSSNTWKNLSLVVLIFGFLLGIFFSIAWDSILHDYQRDRIIAYFNPAETQGDIGFNVNQSRIAIGSGQLFGKGFGNGTQSKRNFLPEHQTDFIFASFAEEFGLAGSIFVLSIYGYLIINCFITAMNVMDDTMASLICVGVGVKLLLEVFINIGTNTGAIPATGIPLPLMSAGGTSSIMTLVSLGLVQNILNKHQSGHKDRSKDILDVYEA